MKEINREVGYVKSKEITEEMQEAYLDYAMSVIVSRALPDVRDGLKPVHRRILYAMWDIGIRSSAKLRKSAYVVGEVLGKYHPHGDVAVYDSMVRLAQNFSLRYPLIQGQGNFGSLDGDSAAAMRYTECRLTPLAEEMLFDIEKETVDWIDSYDGSRQEPIVLPAKVPNLLLNGSMGIAVGMATNIPPHNLGELVDGINHLIDNPKASNEELMKFIKGPDFPTGGAIYDKRAIIQAYATGKGPIVNRAIAEITENKKGQFVIVISEIPYQVNKATLLESIANLVKDKKVEGIKDIRDESDKEGVRIVIDLKSDAYPQKVLNRLYKLTDLQRSFHVNMLGLVDGIQPQIISLKSILEQYILHRKEIVTRRAQFDLTRAKERAHILQGLKKALDHIDAVISTIKRSADRETAHTNLRNKFKFSDTQATAILEMKLQALAGLERKKIEDELKEKRELIQELEILLKSPMKILKLIKTELVDLKEKFGDERKTKIFASPVGQFKEEDLVPNEECIIAITHGGYIKRTNPKLYRAQKRGGKGIMGIATRAEDYVEHLQCISTHDNLIFFTNTGRVYQVKAYEIPEASRVARGQALVNFLQLKSNERVSSMLAIKESLKKNSNEKKSTEKYLVMATKNGIIKKTLIEDFANVRRSGLIVINLQKSDELCWAKLTTGDDEIILITAKGQAIRFKEKDVRSMGRSAAGVRGMRLKKDDKIISMDIINILKDKEKNIKPQILIITQNGFGKKTELKHFKVQRRGGSGIKAAKVTSKTGVIIGTKVLEQGNEDLIVISSKGHIIRTPLNSISMLGRATQGIRIMRLDSNDRVASVTCI